eukprot:2354981-Rhodomonas_salina.2
MGVSPLEFSITAINGTATRINGIMTTIYGSIAAINGSAASINGGRPRMQPDHLPALQPPPASAQLPTRPQVRTVPVVET